MGGGANISEVLLSFLTKGSDLLVIYDIDECFEPRSSSLIEDLFVLTDIFDTLFDTLFDFSVSFFN